MTLKAVLESLDNVAENLRSEYKEKDGKFYLDIEGLDDHHGVGALRRAKEYEKDEARNAKQKSKDLQEKIDNLETELNEFRKNGIPKGDVDKLESSYKEKLDRLTKERDAEIEKLRGALNTELVSNKARDLATKIAAKPEYVEVLLPHIQNRLRLETTGDDVLVRILDKEGKPSAGTLEELEKELLSNKSFAGILAGSKAAGGGAEGGPGGGASSRFNKPFGELNEQERVEWHREDPEGFRKASDKARGVLGSF